MDRSTRPRNLQATPVGRGENGNPVKVLDKLEAYVQPPKNKHIARHKLKLCKQNIGESFDNFVKDLCLILMDYSSGKRRKRKPSRSCLKPSKSCLIVPNDILIDLIIDGVHAKKLQERLLDPEEELTLAKAIEIGQQQYEMSQKLVCVGHDEEPPILALDAK